MNDKKESFSNGIHYFRGFSIILIVSSHILYFDESTLFYKIISAFYLNSTIFYVFISGFLFQHLAHRFNYIKYLKNKWKYVLLPYLIVSIPAIALRLLTKPPYILELVDYNILDYPVVVQIFIYIITGTHLLPLWYLPMVTIFFLLSPIFKFIDSNPITYWMLPLLLILSYLLPRDDLSNLNNIPYMFGHFVSIYCFGMFFSHYQARVQVFTDKYLKIIMIVFLALLFFSVESDSFNAEIIFFQKLTSIFLLMYLFDRSKSKLFTSFFSKMADTSFGIYFIHFYFILVIRMICVKFFGFEYPTNPFSWIITFLSSIIISYYVVKGIKKLSGSKSRYLIGS